MAPRWPHFVNETSRLTRLTTLMLTQPSRDVQIAQHRVGIDAPGGRPYDRRMMKTRGLFALASLLTTASIIASGRPRRIGAHLVRRQLYKQTSRLIRKIK